MEYTVFLEEDRNTYPAIVGNYSDLVTCGSYSMLNNEAIRETEHIQKIANGPSKESR